MIAKPSIAFNDFSGTAKDVTARNVNGRNILSVRAKQSRIISPAQAATRNNLSKISRAYKQLSDSQMTAWESLAVHFTAKSTIGTPASLTAHNVFVKLNSSRVLAGFPMMTDAPVYDSSIPLVEYSDVWISPDVVAFIGLDTPSPDYRLVLKMSSALSPGTSGKTASMVIITPGTTPDWGEADVTSLYTKTLGIAPIEGKTYYAEFWWLDTKTGITGPSTTISCRCKATSILNDDTYEPRNTISQDDIKTGDETIIEDLAIELSPGSIIISTQGLFERTGSGAGVGGDVLKFPENYPNISCYMMGRTVDAKSGIHRVSLNTMYVLPSNNTWRFSMRCGGSWKKVEVFDVSMN